MAETPQWTQGIRAFLGETCHLGLAASLAAQVAIRSRAPHLPSTKTIIYGTPLPADIRMFPDCLMLWSWIISFAQVGVPAAFTGTVSLTVGWLAVFVMSVAVLECLGRVLAVAPAGRACATDTRGD